MSFPNWKPFPNRTSIGFTQIAFPITVLPKDDRTDFDQEERRVFPCWSMIEDICVLVDVSKSLDILTLGSLITSVHLPFWHKCEQILHLLLVLHNLVASSSSKRFLVDSSDDACVFVLRWLLIQYNESRKTCPCIRQFPFSNIVPVIVDLFLRHHI